MTKGSNYEINKHKSEYKELHLDSALCVLNNAFFIIYCVRLKIEQLLHPFMGGKAHYDYYNVNFFFGENQDEAHSSYAIKIPTHSCFSEGNTQFFVPLR
jgi:hypothetical protein